MISPPLSSRLTPSRDSAAWIIRAEAIFKVTICGIDLDLDRFTSVGRLGDIVIFVDTPWVSRKHFEVIANRNGDVWVRDSNSLVGTFINGNRICTQQWFKLEWDDQLTLGGGVPIKIERTLQLFKSNADGLFKALNTTVGKIEAARRSKLRSCKTVQID